MPQKIYSKFLDDNGEKILLLAINKSCEISTKRTDICPDEEYLQISTKILKKGTSFSPHKHNILYRKTDITQEAWVILNGSIMASFWDLDDKKIFSTVLESGDCAVVFRAGHAFEVIEENTILYEFKTGPYHGQEKDKTFIKEEK